MEESNNKKEIELLEDNNKVIKNAVPRIDESGCISGKIFKSDVDIESKQIFKKKDKIDNTVLEASESTDLLKERELGNNDIEMTKFSFWKLWIQLALGIFISLVVDQFFFRVSILVILFYNITVCKFLSEKNKRISILSMISAYIIVPIMTLIIWRLLFFTPVYKDIADIFDYYSLGFVFVLYMEIGLLPYVLYTLKCLPSVQKNESSHKLGIIVLGCIVHVIIVIISFLIVISFAEYTFIIDMFFNFISQLG